MNDDDPVTRKRVTARAAKLRAEERIARAIALRRAGADYRAIGAQLGTSHVHAWRLVAKGLRQLREQRTEDTAALVRLECERLDAVIRSLWSKLQDGSVPAARAIVRCSESRRRLLGLDLPHRVELSGTVAVNELANEPIEVLAERVERALAVLRRPKLELPATTMLPDGTMVLPAPPEEAPPDEGETLASRMDAYARELLVRRSRPH